jgi:outer membrane protein assembly factor BamB
VERRLIYMTYNPFEKRRTFHIPVSSVPPCRLDDGSMIVAALDGVVSRYDSTGGEMWSIDTKTPITAAPVLADSLVLIASGRSMSAHRIRDGEQIWSHRASGAILAPAAVDDRAYFGSTDSLLYAVNLATGSMDWFFATQGQIVVSPVVGENRIYAASNDFRVYALNMESGDTIWSYNAGGPITTRPTLAGNILFIGTQTGELRLIDSNTGTLIRTFKLQGAAASPAIAADGRIFISDTKRRLYCFGNSRVAGSARTSTH